MCIVDVQCVDGGACLSVDSLPVLELDVVLVSEVLQLFVTVLVVDVEELVEYLVAFESGLLECALSLEVVYDGVLAGVLLGFLEVEELVAVGREGACA